MARVQRRKKHHFLPAFLLRNFAGPDGRVQVYDREKNWQSRADIAENLAREKYLYAPGASDEYGRDPKDDAFEVWLADEIDGPAAPAISRLVAGLDVADLTGDETHAVADFVALLDMRIPSIRDRLVPQFDAAARAAISDHKQTKKALRRRGQEMSLGEIKKTARRHRDELASGLAKPAWLDFMKNTRRLARLNIKHRRWSMVDGPVGFEFCTSDLCSVKAIATLLEPVAWEPGTSTWRSHWLIPLSPQRALAITPPEWPGELPASTALVQAINRQFICDAQRYIYTRSAIDIANLVGL
jgi:hypothetical protein